MQAHPPQAQAGEEALLTHDLELEDQESLEIGWRIAKINRDTSTCSPIN